YRDRDRKLLVQLSLDAAHEPDGYEHRREDQGDADHRARYGVHRTGGRLARRQSLFDVPLDRLNHDNRVIDNEADCEDKAEQRQRVDGKTEDWKYHERADQRDRDGYERDQGRTPI